MQRLKSSTKEKGRGGRGGDIQHIARSASVNLNLPNMTLGIVIFFTDVSN